MKIIGQLVIICSVIVMTSCNKETLQEIESFETNNLGFQIKKLSKQGKKIASKTPFAKRVEHSSLVFDNKMWVIAGGSSTTPSPVLNDVWYSKDGKEWIVATEKAAFSERSRQAATVHNKKMWISGGNNGDVKNDVWFSTNGKKWFEAHQKNPFPARSRHTMTSFMGRMFIIGGRNNTTELNDVWISGDGENWSLATAAAPFSPRREHTAVVFDNKLWVIGGHHGGNELLSDVWYTSDGFSWFNATSNADFGPRRNHTSIATKKGIFVIAGTKNNNFEYYDDIWYSTNGIDWNEVTIKAEQKFEERSAHSSVYFDKKLWVIHGFNFEENTTNFLQDIWSFQ